jgi:hypothetical protein
MSFINGRAYAEGVSQQGAEKYILMRVRGFRKLFTEKVQDSCSPNIIGL